MAYDPFERGNLPVGVRTFNWSDPDRNDRLLTVEAWYPATETHRGQDLAEATRDTYELIPGFPPGWQDAVRDAAPRVGRFPLVMFSHGFGAHRRQSTFLCTHLASHGYVVAAMDHAGNTIFETVQMMMAAQMGGPPPDTIAILSDVIPARPVDVSFVIDRLLAGLEGLPELDADRIGMSGHSFGGWTTLMVAGRDRRACGWRSRSPWLDAASGRAVAEGARPCVGTRRADAFPRRRPDTILPLRGMRELRSGHVAETHGDLGERRPHALLRSGRADPRALPDDAAADLRSGGELDQTDRRALRARRRRPVRAAWPRLHGRALPRRRGGGALPRGDLVAALRGRGAVAAVA
jgi:hypothetical protein